LGLSFFGLTSNDPNTSIIKLQIYKQIHQICFYGKGGYSWPVVYNMPIYIRRFIFNEIKQFYEEEKESHKKASSKSTNLKNSETQSFNMGSPSKSNPKVLYK
jgi:hypothetical protein